LARRPAAASSRKKARPSRCIDLAAQDYRDFGRRSATPTLLAILKIRNPAEKFEKLRASMPSPQAQFLWAIFRDIFHYVRIPP
jgi:3-hydroxyacyl-CoA dehydrogenase